MNKFGFTLIELLATIVIIAIVMGIILPGALRVSRENSVRMYEEYERMMEEYALTSSKKGEATINLDDLDVPGKIKDECTGYVELISSEPIQYKAHITCGDKYP